jgi:hypothetical protein
MTNVAYALGALVLAAGLACAVGCGGGPLDDIDVKSATLSNTEWGGVGVVGGFSTTPAVLTLVDNADVGHAFNVSIGGPTLGLIFDFGAADDNPDDCLMQSSASLTIPEGKSLTGSDIAGGYFGSKTSGHLVLGGEDHDLSNGEGVKLKGGAVNFGLGMQVAFEWLSISVDESDSK